jgi:hypothetical protein
MVFLLLLASAILAFTCSKASALIFGGEGNSPLNDPGWPEGAAAIFNVKSRIAWWEGPPLGGGQWHAECRGDAKALSAVLADFAKLDVKAKRIVLVDGVGTSFWLRTGNAPAKRDATMDWSFTVWRPDSWKRLRKLPADLNPTDPKDAKNGPPAQIDVYTGGNIKWANVIVPKGLKIVDQRLEAHGFTLRDGVVLEGKVTDLATKKPLTAKVRLELITPKKDGYDYSTVAKAATDAKGHWVLKKTPAGWHRVVIEAEGYVPRVLGWLRADDQPRWHQYDGGLARPATVSGRVTDDAGKPLANVEVRIHNVTTATGAHYESAGGSTLKTGADGRFRTDQIPAGRATIWLYKPGYCRPGLDQSFTTPKKDIKLTMLRAGRIVVSVNFAGKVPPEAYIVRIEPEGGEAVGKYGGSGQVNANKQITFDNVPPGRYVLRGRPNPGADKQQTDPVTVDLKGGKTVEIKLNAK